MCNFFFANCLEIYLILPFFGGETKLMFVGRSKFQWIYYSLGTLSFLIQHFIWFKIVLFDLIRNMNKILTVPFNN